MKMYICAIKIVTKGMKPIKMMRLNAVSTIASQKSKFKQTINECIDDF